MAHTMEDLREIVTKELDEINKRGELDEPTLKCVYQLVDILKDIGEIEGQEMGYAEMMYPYAMESRESYRGGNSNRYSGAGYSNRQRRDSMGRFSNAYGGGSNAYAGGGSNAYGGSYRGYSRDGEDIMAKMERMMDTAGSETERQMIQRIMSQM